MPVKVLYLPQWATFDGSGNLIPEQDPAYSVARGFVELGNVDSDLSVMALMPEGPRVLASDDYHRFAKSSHVIEHQLQDGVVDSITARMSSSSLAPKVAEMFTSTYSPGNRIVIVATEPCSAMDTILAARKVDRNVRLITCNYYWFFPDTEEDVSFWFRQEEGHHIADMCAFMCKETMNKYVMMSSGPRVFRASVWEVAVNESEFDPVRRKAFGSHPTVVFPNRLCSTRYNNWREVCSAIDMVQNAVLFLNPSRKNGEMQLHSELVANHSHKSIQVLNNADEVMRFVQVSDKGAVAIVGDMAHFTRADYLKLLNTQSCCYLALYVNEFHGGQSSREAMASRNVVLTLRRGGYLSTLGDCYPFTVAERQEDIVTGIVAAVERVNHFIKWKPAMFDAFLRTVSENTIKQCSIQSNWPKIRADIMEVAGL